MYNNHRTQPTCEGKYFPTFNYAHMEEWRQLHALISTLDGNQWWLYVAGALRVYPKQPHYALGFEMGSRIVRREMTKLIFSVFPGFPAYKITTKFTDITRTPKWILNVQMVVDSTSTQKKSFIIKSQILMLSKKSRESLRYTPLISWVLNMTTKLQYWFWK